MGVETYTPSSVKPALEHMLYILTRIGITAIYNVQFFNFIKKIIFLIGKSVIYISDFPKW